MELRHDVVVVGGGNAALTAAISAMEAGARVEKNPEKKNPLDFALWIKAEPNHIMKWSSPWSLGYPGWHIECSAMSMKYLGEVFDIHGGGKDHIFPHHSNERAQSLAATGKEFVRYWLHANFLQIGGEKMSKSKGNFYTAREMIDKYGGEVLRLFYASSHYRKDIEFAEEAVEHAKNNLERIYNTLYLIESSKGGKKTDLKDEIKRFVKDFEEAMDDDLDTPRAVKLLLEFCKKVNKSLDNKRRYLRGRGRKSGNWEEFDETATDESVTDDDFSAGLNTPGLGRVDVSVRRAAGLAGVV